MVKISGMPPDTAPTLTDSVPLLDAETTSNKRVTLSDIADLLAGSIFPTGTIVPYGGTAAPTGFLLCYGQAISRTDYADLFSAISTTYGTGDGSTTFNLPDLRGRVVAGQDDMGGTSANRLTNQSGGLNGDTLGATGGAETHTLTEAETPSVQHKIGGTAGRRAYSPDFNNGTSAGGGAAVWGAATIDNHGSGGAHNNVQPTIILNYIIRT